MNEKISMLGIAGASCSGKTLLSRLLVDTLGKENCALLPLDCYYHDLSHLDGEEQEKHNYDEPLSLEADLFLEQISSLRKGSEVMVPVYDYRSHSRRSARTKISPARIVIIEGLFALYWEKLRDMLDIKVFLTIGHREALNRRLARDTSDRGFTPEYVRFQYEDTVAPMYEKHVAPTIRHADMVLKGEDPLKKSAETIIERLKKLKIV